MDSDPASRQLASTEAHSVTIGDFREWTGGHFARQPIYPPSTLKLRNVDVLVIEDRCKGCSFCIEFCPKHVLELSTNLNVRGVHPPHVKDAELCVGCGICEELCPDFAIFLVDREERK
jgi:2-oxoglutarate ferredoxin oxidoreductase subunit delta